MFLSIFVTACTFLTAGFVVGMVYYRWKTQESRKMFMDILQVNNDTTYAAASARSDREIAEAYALLDTSGLRTDDGEDDEEPSLQ